MADDTPADAITVTSWSSPPWDGVERGEVAGRVTGGHKYALYPIGTPGEVDHRSLIITYHPPFYEVPAHAHDEDVLEVVVQGSYEADGVSHGPGFVWFVRAGTTKPPTVAGAEGYTKVVLHCQKDLPDDRSRRT